MAVIDEILALYARRGSEAYFGECVSMTEHGLQAAHFTREAGAAPALIVAALLHDVGHLVEDVANDLADWTTDAEHERVGGAWLARRFPPAVSEPVRLHVPAKRYLLATDADYLAMLSPASVVTLKLQGGPMSPGKRLGSRPRRSIGTRCSSGAATIEARSTDSRRHGSKITDR